MKSRIELNEDERYSLYVRTRHRKKLLTIIISLIIIMSLLTVRIGCIMTVEAGYYSRKATELHERERAIKAYLMLMEQCLQITGQCVLCQLYITR